MDKITVRPVNAPSTTGNPPGTTKGGK